jgi:hypothetical protein
VAVKATVTHIAVGYDGAWHGRKDTSGYVNGSVTDIITGLVTDSEIISKCCQTYSSAKRSLGKEVSGFFFLYERHV